MKIYERTIRYTLIVVVVVLFSWLVFVSQAHAEGVFLDLGAGAMISKYDNQDGSNGLGAKFPVGMLRFGYQTESYNLHGNIDVSAQSYYEHMDSFGTSDNGGVDIFMMGVRFE